MTEPSEIDAGMARAAEKLDGAISKALENPPKPAVKLAQPTRHEVLKFLRAVRRKSINHEASR